MRGKCASLLLTVMCLSPAPIASGAVIFSDDFESYANTAALNAVWPKGSGTGSDATTFLDNGPAGSTNTSKTVHHTNRLTRRDRNFIPTVPTDANPLVVQFDLYDTTAATDTGAGQFNQLLAFNGPNLTQLISMGKALLAGAEGAADPTRYQARVAFGSLNWLNLNTPRSVGWHTFRAEITDNSVSFFVDGVADRTVNFTGGVGDPFTQARIGSGLSARAEEAYYDNYSIEVVPEPATAGLLGLGALGLLARRRRAV